MSKKVTLGLSQIVKNEEHVITRMLDSIKDIVDYLTFVDTGSTDNTKEVITNWAKEHNIPCDIYDKEFDNFENCRNYAMQMSKDKTDYSFWLDADEILVLDKTFNKNNITKDIYMFNTNIGTMKYTRNELWTNKKDFKWYGPVHEFIVPSDPNTKLTSDIMKGVEVDVKTDGGSWKEDVSKKYRTHASMLENYIDYTDRDPRWVFYTAQSYHDSACVPNNKEENDERLRRSMKYYNERLNMKSGYSEERYYSKLRIGTIQYRLERPFEEVLEHLLGAYRMDVMRAEPFRVIIEHFQRMNDWNMAYLYSKFAYTTYHNNSPYPNKVLFVDATLYNWRLAEFYANACFQVGRKQDAKIVYQEVFNLTKTKPHVFAEEDINRITANSRFFI